MKLDGLDPGNTAITVTSDESDWVDVSYSSVKDVLARFASNNGYIRNKWTEFIIQILGVFVGFVISLWAGSLIADKLKGDNMFLVGFVLSLLLFSNVWTYGSRVLFNFVNTRFPNVEFFRPDKERLHWLVQTVFGGVVVALTLYLIGLIFGYAGTVLSEYIPST